MFGRERKVFTIREALHALYRGVLDREPEAHGLQFYTDRLRKNPKELLSIASDFYNSDERRTNLSKMIKNHSQYGEFPKILLHVARHGVNHRVIVDVGARGRERSNSYDLLSQCGWSGLLVEANPALYDRIVADFEDTNARVVSCAIGDREGVLPLYIGENLDVSSLREEMTSA